MREQRYVIKNIESFEPKHIFECGQCFRWNIEDDGSYTGVVKNNVLNVKKEENSIIIKGMCEDNLEELCKDYFDLDTDYQKIKNELSKLDNNLRVSIKYGKGIRILKQDIWEALISFIISANNNIPRIKGIIERISKQYGEEIIWDNKKYYTFPNPEQLSNASVSDLRKLGLGFRDVRIFETCRLINQNIISIEELETIKNIDELKEQLLRFPGVGPKVADCIMLFSMKKLEVFPIDVWVKRVMTELYGDEIRKLKNNSTIISNKQILEYAQQYFGNLAGVAQQYLFYWRRDL